MENKNLLNVWAKTLLSVYRYIDTVNSSIENLVLKQALNRGYGGGRMNSVHDVANKIIELTERKKILLKGAHIIEDSLARLNDDDVRLLMLVYFDLVKSQKCADILEISIRTFFRRKKLAIEKFANSLKFLGNTSMSLYNLFKGEEWLINLYNKNFEAEFSDKLTKSEPDITEGIYEYSLLKSIIKDLSKTGKRKTAYGFKWKFLNLTY